MTRADILFVNGKVHTVDPDDKVVSALAVADGVIHAVGGREEVEERIAGAERVVDLRGGTLLPGINDSHLHAVNTGYNAPPFSVDLNYPTVSSIVDCVAAVKERAAETAAGEWIVGVGWDTGYLKECVEDPTRQPTRQDLDAATREHPVFLHDFSRHTAWVNSAALAKAGIDRDTPTPPGSVIARDADGEPTGLLAEGAAVMVEKLLPPITVELSKAAILSTVAKLSRLGITSLTEPGLGPGGNEGIMGMGENGLHAYRELLLERQLRVRLSALLYVDETGNGFETFKRGLDSFVPPESPDERFCKVIGVKLFADGIPPQKTAWMHDEYLGGGFGGLVVGGEDDAERLRELQKMISYAHSLGHQVGTHVTGDRGNDVVVEAYAQAVREAPREDSRHYVIHGDFITAQALRICREEGFGANFNPTIKWTIADLEKEMVGEERAAYEWPYRSAIDAGVTVSSSSDSPVTEPDWRQGVATMMLREAKADGEVSGPGERITLAEAIRTYTINPAWQDFAEGWKGSLEVGKVADLCVLEQDLEAIDPHEIADVDVAMTMIDGEVAFERASVA
ncbi:MAG: amidohydrolase [Actinobacteria bacterium]|nr:amidohydrolase [Actinomycetota bacterium]